MPFLEEGTLNSVFVGRGDEGVIDNDGVRKSVAAGAALEIDRLNGETREEGETDADLDFDRNRVDLERDLEVAADGRMGAEAGTGGMGLDGDVA